MKQYDFIYPYYYYCSEVPPKAFIVERSVRTLLKNLEKERRVSQILQNTPNVRLVNILWNGLDFPQDKAFRLHLGIVLEEDVLGRGAVSESYLTSCINTTANDIIQMVIHSQNWNFSKPYAYSRAEDQRGGILSALRGSPPTMEEKAVATIGPSIMLDQQYRQRVELVITTAANTSANTPIGPIPNEEMSRLPAPPSVHPRPTLRGQNDWGVVEPVTTGPVEKPTKEGRQKLLAVGGSAQWAAKTCLGSLAVSLSLLNANQCRVVLSLDGTTKHEVIVEMQPQSLLSTLQRGIPKVILPSSPCKTLSSSQEESLE